ncbi:restriction endonuclease subunit S [Ureaplasma parvum]|uniref:restriction endonuclease subunit S n=1 Tax=Ureaplasma parvum TaxID=134821 RepID=UPI0022B6EAEC|nr:restriction endonuclease subunit S [Ureaplasma parvum]
MFKFIKTGNKNANAEKKNGDYIFWTCNKLPKKIDTYSFDGEALLVPGNGDLGNVNYFKGKFDAYQRTYVLMEPNENINIKFVYHLLKNSLKNYFSTNQKNSVISYIKLPILENFTIPIPHISIQNKIVEILDKLEAYTKDIGVGLPFEIKQRKKQYEYYRNKLLDFKKY